MIFAMQFLIASLSFMLAFALWYRAIPPVIAMRGRWHALAVWAQGMALAIFGSAFLGLALADDSGGPLLITAQLCLMASAAAQLRRARGMGTQRWSCPAPPRNPEARRP